LRKKNLLASFEGRSFAARQKTIAMPQHIAAAIPFAESCPEQSDHTYGEGVAQSVTPELTLAG